MCKIILLSLAVSCCYCKCYFYQQDQLFVFNQQFQFYNNWEMESKFRLFQKNLNNKACINQLNFGGDGETANISDEILSQTNITDRIQIVIKIIRNKLKCQLRLFLEGNMLRFIKKCHLYINLNLSIFSYSINRCKISAIPIQLLKKKP